MRELELLEVTDLRERRSRRSLLLNVTAPRGTVTERYHCAGNATGAGSAHGMEAAARAVTMPCARK